MAGLVLAGTLPLFAQTASGGATSTAGFDTPSASSGNGVSPAVGATGVPASVSAQTIPSQGATAADIAAQNRSRINSQNPPSPTNSVQNTSVAPLTDFQQMVLATTGRALPVFGAGLFRGAPSTFAPLEAAPIPSDYVIGPGDDVNIQLWGQNTMLGTYAVDRQGNLQLPSVGTVQVAGLHYSDLDDFLRKKYEAFYRGTGFSVSLAGLRSIQIFVTGAGASSPGSYTVSSLSTLIDALFNAGGPSPNGTLRDIQVVRGNTTIVHFDLYDFLLRGDKSKSVRLEPGDTIVIPVVGKEVAVTGSVNVPAVYELKDEITVPQVLALAGGESTVAAGTTVRLERIYEHAQRVVQDVDLKAAPVAVQAGDIVMVTAIVDRFRNAVTLRGNVLSPGRRVWQLGMRMSDLIPNKESLITRSYFGRQNELGQVLPQPGSGVGLPASTTNSIDVTNAGNAGSTTGASVGTALTQNGSGFGPQNDVVLTAPDIDWNYAVIERLNMNTLQTSLIPFNLGRLVLDGDQSQNLELQPGDVVTIFSKADIAVPIQQRTRFVRLEGEFNGAGLYSVLPGETLRQLIARAGGVTSDAYLYGAEFTRQSVQRVERQRLLAYADEMDAQISSQAAARANRPMGGSDQTAALIASTAQEERAAVARLRTVMPTGRMSLGINPDSTGITDIADVSLEDGDRFVVPHRPDSILVEGQVYNASAFLFHSGWRVKQYLQAAGGPNRNADKGRIFLLRADGSVVSNQYAKVANLIVYPGDTIVVPQSTSGHSFYRNLVDVGAVLSGLGVPLTTLYLLARQ